MKTDTQTGTQKPIRIDIKNVARLEQALAVAQCRCSARLISVKNIHDMGRRAVEALKKIGVRRSDMTGRIVRWHNGCGDFPIAYHGRPESTSVTYEITARGVAVIDIYRGAAYGRETLLIDEDVSLRDLIVVEVRL